MPAVNASERVNVAQDEILRPVPDRFALKSILCTWSAVMDELNAAVTVVVALLAVPVATDTQSTITSVHVPV